MNVNKGGRGIKAPYSSKVVRIPEPILDRVNEILDNFYNGTAAAPEVDRESAIKLGIDILQQNKVSKRSTKVCLEKLLQVIYSDNTIKL